jgi:hypothetical protein
MARAVGEIAGFITMLQTACADRQVNDRLERLLSLPDERRRALVHTWVSDLMIARAPQDLIDAVACLLDDRVSEKAYEVIFECGRG